MGSDLSCTPGKRAGVGGVVRARERVLSPLSPSSPPSIFFFCVNFFPALCYLNAWNRLVERIWRGGGGGGHFWQFLVLLTLFSDQKMSQLAYFSFFLTHLSEKDSNDSRSSRSCPKRHLPIWLKKGSTPPLPGGKEHRSFFGKIFVSPYVRESKTVLSRFDARDSGFRNICQWNVGRFPFNKNSGLKFRKLHVLNGTVHCGCTDPTRATARFVIVASQHTHNYAPKEKESYFV